MILSHREKLFKTTLIHDNLVDISNVFDEQTKRFFKSQSSLIRNFLNENPKANSYHLQTLTNGLLKYWNESIKPETEFFWTELKLNNIDFERKEPLRFALNKNRFSVVEQGIDARNYWGILKTNKSITDNFSKFEINKIDNIITEDEKRRFDILKKCLTKKAIPQTLYLKFGECMAYFNNCQLFEKHFTVDDVKELYTIWKNF